MKTEMPETTQKEMNEFVNAILKAEWAAENEASRKRELQSLTKKHGHKKARRILAERIAGLEALVNMENAQAIERWKARKPVASRENDTVELSQLLIRCLTAE